MTGSLIFSARLLRREVRRARQLWRFRRASLAGIPILFANSFPKSGTHLLTQLLHGFTHLGPAVDSGLPAIVTYEGETGRPRPSHKILRDLERLKAGDIAYGHLHAVPAILSFLSQPEVATCFIFRDPRDVVVSHVFYVTELASRHVHHRYYVEELHSFDERLTVSILGRPDWCELFPNIYARFEPYLGWCDRDDVLALRYEQFLSDRPTAIGRVLDHAVARGFPLKCDRQAALQILASSIHPQRSPTFRRGQAGGWREYFSPQHKQLFKDAAGNLLIYLGYESDWDW